MNPLDVNDLRNRLLSARIQINTLLKGDPIYLFVQKPGRQQGKKSNRSLSLSEAPAVSAADWKICRKFIWIITKSDSNCHYISWDYFLCYILYLTTTNCFVS